MLGSLVMAWARDSATGQPRYIGEIDAEHRGGKCGCECPSCRLPLIAVNAAKDTVMRRPHFRHPEGAQRDECAILAARSAALQLLAEEGVIELPRRRMSARAQGLSGAQHEAWVEAPSQRLRISSIDFHDRAFALLTLDDGRQLRVALTGGMSAEISDDGSVLLPTISIDVPAAIAGMDKAEIRKRLQLLPEGLCWHSHWHDAELEAEAKRRATAMAEDALDWLPSDVVLPDGLSPAMQRESLLHHEVKRILQTAGRVAVPALEVLEQLQAEGLPTLQRRFWVEDRLLSLSEVRLEHRMRPLIPDVVCEARSRDGSRFSPLVIEVTVSNPIDDERRTRISALGVAALEIDLSLTGGRVTRAQLEALVVDEVFLKRWLHYPALQGIREGLQEQMRGEHQQRIAAQELAAERQRRIQVTPIEELARDYLEAVQSMLIEQHALAPGGDPGQVRSAEALVAARVEEMAMRGFPECADEALLGRTRILARLLSIRADKGIGYAHAKAAGVLNAIKQSQPANRSDWTLYLIAVRVYLPRLAEDSSTWAWYKPWRDDVGAAVKREDSAYLRSPRYDRLLSLLFPEMAAGLAKPIGKQPAVPNIRWDQSKDGFVRTSPEPIHRPAALLAGLADRGQHAPIQRSTSRDIRAWYLRGAELEAWKRANPEAAADWAETLRRDGVE